MHLSCTNSHIKLWSMISCLLRAARNIGKNSVDHFMRFLNSDVIISTHFSWLFRYKFQSSLGAYEDKTATLSDADNVWVDTRHLHMRETIDKLMADFNIFLEEHAGFKG